MAQACVIAAMVKTNVENVKPPNGGVTVSKSIEKQDKDLSLIHI